MRTRRRAEVAADRRRRRACAPASRAPRRGRSRAPTCAAPRSGRRTARRPCRSGAGCCATRVLDERRRRCRAPCAARGGLQDLLEQVEQRAARRRRRSRSMRSRASSSNVESGIARSRARSNSSPRSSALEALQHVDRGARQQRAVHLERRILGGRADEGEQALLDERQEGVLLRLVEAVHLVDEQDGVRGRCAASASSARCTASRMSFTPESTAESAMNSASKAFAIRRASVVLPDARRPPQDHRVRLARLEREAQRLARPEQVALADHLVERARAQALGERRVRARSRLRTRVGPNEVGHRGPTSSPITSAPLGGVKRNVAGVELRVALEARRSAARVVWPKLSMQLHAPRGPARRSPGGCARSRPRLSRGIASTQSRPSRAPSSRSVERAASTSLRAGEQRRGRRAERLVELAHRDLVQVLVVDPDARAVADDELLVRLLVAPAELARAREREACRSTAAPPCRSRSTTVCSNSPRARLRAAS